jgi:hypothetical protein
MDIKLKDYSDLAKAYQGKYEGDDTYLRRINNEVKARRGEYKGFSTYLRRISNEARAGRGDSSLKRFPTKIIAVSLTSLAIAGIGILAYCGKLRKKGAHE